MTKSVSIIFFVAVLMVSQLTAIAGDTEEERATLRGISGLYVVVEDIAPKAERKGLTAKIVRTDVELKLRLAGIKVLTEQEWLADTTDSPMYHVDVHILVDDDPPYYTYRIGTSINERVYIVRTWERTWGITWSTSFLGYTSDLRDIRNSIKDYVDRFINAYLSVNPIEKINQTELKTEEDG